MVAPDPEARVRVGFVASSATYGGAEFYLDQLLSGLPSRVGRALIGVGELPPRLVSSAESLGVAVATAPVVRNKFDIANHWRLRRALRRAKVDLIHVNLSSATNNRWAIAAAMSTGVPVVVTLHLREQVTSRLQRRLLRILFSRLRGAIAVADEVAEQLTAELGVKPDRVKVVHNGVQRREEPPPPDREGGSSSARSLRVSAIGRLEAQKGFDVLIAAVGLLDSSVPRCEVVIAGDGAERSALETAAVGLPVSFVGDVDVHQLLATTDLFCLPSRWEGLPFVLLEAMMAGLPCVVSDVGDVVTAVADTAIVVAPDDAKGLAAALASLLGDPAERHRLGTAASERARHRFTLDRMVEETLSVYDEVLAR